MITTLVFDIGGVFLHQPEELTNAVWSGLGLVDPGVTDELLYGDEMWTVYKRGGMTEEEYWTQMLQRLPVQYDGTWESLCHSFERGVVLSDDLVSLARELQSSFYIHALSNAGAELERRLDFFGITNLFGEIINSHRVKMAKPDKSIYTLTCERIGALPEEILFVDDKYRNTSVADEMGFHTHVYTTVENLKQHLTDLNLYGERTTSV